MSLEGHYDARAVEARLQQRWTDLQIYAFDPQSQRPLFSIDTPPPTVSGEIHIGHVYSYTQADILARYQRMRGHMVFYPFGFDDNGLPTERFTEQARGITVDQVGREAFIRACLELSAETEARFEQFWRRLGLGVDWRLRYSTIDARARRIAQQSFLELYQHGAVQRREAPTLWCPHCRTAVAQADVDDRDGVPTTFVTLAFPTTDGREIRIATTRPELLPACGAVFVHPDDPRSASLIGSTARVSLFGLQVPVLANPDVDREKGTGAVMCCTFGDAADVRWWYSYRLPLRAAIHPDGTMSEMAGPYAGLTVAEARAAIIDDLGRQGLLRDRQSITHTIGVHERCGTPVEYLVSQQWFIGILALQDRLLDAGRQICWYPGPMRVRYEHWVTGLSWDWNISRQRTYGVPFPVWYCEDCGSILLAAPEQLPVDPNTTAPRYPCTHCGSSRVRPDQDVMDTWATSSLTPLICASLAADFGDDEQTFLAAPMGMRANAHDIIRTWDFYTIVRSLLRNDQIPWHTVLIAGHALNPEGQKISKSKLRAAIDPAATIERFSADAVRYWTVTTRMGLDTAISEETFRQGQRLVTKLWNAARFVLAQTTPSTGDGTQRDPVLVPTDRWILTRLSQTVAQATVAMDEREPATARSVVERFFWSDFCDTYLELVKYRLRGQALADGTAATQGERAAAAATLRGVLRAVLALFAPILPFSTEEIYLQGFAAAEGEASIHSTHWPTADAYPADAAVLAAGEVMLAVIGEVRRWKSAQALSVGTPVMSVTVTCPPEQLSYLAAMRLDLACIARADTLILQPGPLPAVAVDRHSMAPEREAGQDSLQ